MYFSGITLSIYGEAGRAGLFAALEGVRARGGCVAFDTNFRARGWPDRGVARALYGRAMGLADIVLASAEDLDPLFGDGEGAMLAHGRAGAELVLKLERPGCRVRHEGREVVVEAGAVGRVVDTTAAGDSFAAGYLAARLGGAGPAAAARAGHGLAGVVVGYPGAIIPRGAMPVLEGIRG